MKTRTERYLDNNEDVVRTNKNKELYDDIYKNSPLSYTPINNNENEIDITKLNELLQNREGYRKVSKYREIVNDEYLEEDNIESDIYKEIDEKIYDINLILEDAKNKREDSLKTRSLRNTQYNILSKLDLNEKNEEPEMDKEFFSKDKVIDTLMEENDLLDELKGKDNTILTGPINNNEVSNDSFYTSKLNFTKEDFEGFQDLQTTVKKNNTLIKYLISLLVIVLISISAFVIYFIN